MTLRMEATFTGTQPLSTGEMSAGASDTPPTFRVTFTNVGVFDYQCLVHPGMNGTVEVAPAGATPPETPAQAQARGQTQAGSLAAAVRADIQAARSAHGTAPGGSGNPHRAGGRRRSCRSRERGRRERVALPARYTHSTAR